MQTMLGTVSPAPLMRWPSDVSRTPTPLGCSDARSAANRFAQSAERCSDRRSQAAPAATTTASPRRRTDRSLVVTTSSTPLRRNDTSATSPASTTSWPLSIAAWIASAIVGGIRCRSTSHCRRSSRRNRRWSSHPNDCHSWAVRGRTASITCRQSTPPWRACARSAASAARNCSSETSAASASRWGNSVGAPVARNRRGSAPLRDSSVTVAPRAVRCSATSTPVSPEPITKTLAGRGAPRAASAPGAHGSSTTLPSAPSASTGAKARSNESGMPLSGRPDASTTESADNSRPSFSARRAGWLGVNPMTSADSIRTSAVTSWSCRYRPHASRGAKLSAGVTARSSSQRLKCSGSSGQADMRGAGTFSRCVGSSGPYAAPQAGRPGASINVICASGVPRRRCTAASTPAAPPPTIAMRIMAEGYISPARPALQAAQIVGDVHGVLLQGFQRHDVEGPLMGGRQHHRGGETIAVGQQPVAGGDAPPVPGYQTGKPELRHGCREIVADHALVLEEFGSHHSANRVQAEIFRPARAATVAVKAGERLAAARFQRTAQYVALRHSCPALHRLDQVPGPLDLFEVGTGWDELDFVSPDRFELTQNRDQIVFATGEAGRGRHRINVFGRYPVHVPAQVPVHLAARLVD